MKFIGMNHVSSNFKQYTHERESNSCPGHFIKSEIHPRAGGLARRHFTSLSFYEPSKQL